MMKEGRSAAVGCEGAIRMNRVLAASFVVLIAACGTSPHHSQDSQGSLDGGDDAGGFTSPASDASGAQGGFDANVAQGKLAVKLVTLSCSGDCATVQAVGTGGSPPYSYEWEDGSTSAVRQLCPKAATAYAVNVTDTGEAGEIPGPPQTAKASVTADVLACPDAGAVDAAPPAPPTDACVGGLVNASIEGTPQSKVGLAWDAPGWTQCPNKLYPATLASAGVHPSDGPTYPAPSSGATYAVFGVQGAYAVSGADDLPVGFGQTLCTPLQAGASFDVDARWMAPGASPEPAGTGVDLQIFGGPTVCGGLDEARWAVIKPSITQTWSTYCFTVPLDAAAVASITFTGIVNLNGSADPSVSALLLIDHVVPVASCM
jgi:hypothetical protein